ncbi:ArsR/SmtB family transcription factor [Actinomadura montaniterrae]|uniref:Helix-turn-helix transcriptional regulator n=1 Tax=Actinomadura montaniterrae TaxID=1803903 RepID=A0A6L3VQR9_9ACTN|nr:metalloregulator ArsR/SmtB family transcription factor [Actinomadura montaniterrae]KAB2374182.1 helix-turn-helix transcriptional regulator [Actinomadura montaniterrae]
MADADDSKVTDERVLAAMAHPLRRRLLDVLKVHGPATASALAGRTGQAVPNISHHLKVLGAAGLIVEAPELARDRRERWWRLAAPEIRWVTADFDDDPARQAVAGAAVSLGLDRQVGLVRAWFAVREERPAWNGAAFSVDTWLRLTPAELGELEREILAVLDRWERRGVPDDGQAREPVFLFAHGVPAQP